MIARKNLMAMFAGLVTLLVASAAYAEEASAVALSDRDKWIGITCGFGIALAKQVADVRRLFCVGSEQSLVALGEGLFRGVTPAHPPVSV